MKVLIIGLGSIGRRYLRLLQDNYNYDLFAFRSSKGQQSTNEVDIPQLTKWDEVRDLRPDVVLITNPTFLHVETAMACARLGCRLFIEKPLAHTIDGLDELLSLIDQQELPTYVAYNLRFHPVIQRVKDEIDRGGCQHLRVTSTSYLPDWRPGQDHLQSYSARLEMGGGVLLDLSHELDYTAYLLGGIDAIGGRHYRRGEVTVDAEDYGDLLVQTPTAPANIHIDFASHRSQRVVTADFPEYALTGDLIRGTLTRYEHGQVTAKEDFGTDLEHTYLDQLAYFFDNLDNPRMMNHVAEAAELLEKLLAFKEAGV